MGSLPGWTLEALLPSFPVPSAAASERTQGGFVAHQSWLLTSPCCPGPCSAPPVVWHEGGHPCLAHGCCGSPSTGSIGPGGVRQQWRKAPQSLSASSNLPGTQPQPDICRAHPACGLLSSCCSTTTPAGPGMLPVQPSYAPATSDCPPLPTQWHRLGRLLLGWLGQSPLLPGQLRGCLVPQAGP